MPAITQSVPAFLPRLEEYIRCQLRMVLKTRDCVYRGTCFH